MGVRLRRRFVVAVRALVLVGSHRVRLRLAALRSALLRRQSVRRRWFRAPRLRLPPRAETAAPAWLAIPVPDVAALAPADAVPARLGPPAPAGLPVSLLPGPCAPAVVRSSAARCPAARGLGLLPALLLWRTSPSAAGRDRPAEAAHPGKPDPPLAANAARTPDAIALAASARCCFAGAGNGWSRSGRLAPEDSKAAAHRPRRRSRFASASNPSPAESTKGHVAACPSADTASKAAGGRQTLCGFRSAPPSGRRWRPARKATVRSSAGCVLAKRRARRRTGSRPLAAAAESAPAGRRNRAAPGADPWRSRWPDRHCRRACTGVRAVAAGRTGPRRGHTPAAPCRRPYPG